MTKGSSVGGLTTGASGSKRARRFGGHRIGRWRGHRVRHRLDGLRHDLRRFGRPGADLSGDLSGNPARGLGGKPTEPPTPVPIASVIWPTKPASAPPKSGSAGKGIPVGPHGAAGTPAPTGASP